MMELLPCPFCGEFAEFGQIADDCMPPHPDQGGHFIQCTNNACGASTNLRFAFRDDPRPLLAEQWNRRAATERQAAFARAMTASKSDDLFEALIDICRPAKGG
jgi:sarcosine oxidase delta subunit